MYFTYKGDKKKYPIKRVTKLAKDNLFCMKNMTSIQRIVLVAFCLPLMCSCAVLHSSQIQMAEELCDRVDTLHVIPEQVLETLAASRLERGLYFTATLVTEEFRIQQLNELVDFRIEEEKLIRKTLACSDVLGSYFRSLKSLCSPVRYQQFGAEMRGIGRNLDSLIHYYNELGIGIQLPEGYAKTTGKAVGLGTETWVRHKQARYVKDYVQMADTLIGIYCDSLAVLLSGPQIKSLFEHEKIQLEDEYRMYLMLCQPLSGREEDRSYLEMRRQLLDAQALLRKVKSALTSLKKAHHKLALSLNQRSEIDQVYPEILEFNAILSQLW